MKICFYMHCIMCSMLAILPWCAVLVSGLDFVLQFIVLPSDEWGHFVTRAGVPQERGHFGLWRLCSVKFRALESESEETCVHPEDTAYDLPTYASAAGAISIVHLLLMVSFFVLACVRVLQLARDAPDLYLGTKRLCVVKVSLAVICVLVSISTAILASVGEGRVRQFDVYKGWAFWLHIVVISIDIVLLLVCAFENIQFWQIDMTQPAPKDVTDEFPETFVAPDYDLPPELREDRVVYVKDASVQSQLDGYDDGYLRVPRTHYDHHRETNPKQLLSPEGAHFQGRSPTVAGINSRGSPHPRKKTLAH